MESNLVISRFRMTLAVPLLAVTGATFGAEPSRLVRVLPRRSLYTHEKQAEVIVDLADEVELESLSVELAGDGIPKTGHAVTARRMLLPVALEGLVEGVHGLTCRVLRGEELVREASIRLRTAAPKPNEVKIDHLTGGLIVDGLPLIPLGYYTYYPLAKGVMDEEVVRGFTLFSPYHGGPHLAVARQPIKQYMDRCVITVLAVNTQNRPGIVQLTLPGVDYTGPADVLFENRKVSLKDGAIEEPVDAYGTRAYAIPVGPMPEEDLSVDRRNLTTNPSYEQNPSVGTPAGCYASIPPGATCLIDSRIARHGRHSLRMTAPADDKTPKLSPFPVSLKARGAYRVSIWARGKSEAVRLKVSLGQLGRREFALTPRWREYTFDVTSETDVGRAGPRISLCSAGVAWLDLFQIVPVGTDSNKRQQSDE